MLKKLGEKAFKVFVSSITLVSFLLLISPSPALARDSFEDKEIKEEILLAKKTETELLPAPLPPVPTPPPPPVPPERIIKKKKTNWLLIILGVILLGGAAACLSQPSGGPGPGGGGGEDLGEPPVPPEE